MIAAGTTHRFGENPTTDDIIAGKYKHETTDLDRLAPHLMENIRPGFADVVAPGDFIVAGQNFGYGSSREQAPRLLAHAGVTAVVAPSFARIFFRNAINVGLLLLTCPTDGVEEGDRLAYDDEAGTLTVAGAAGEHDAEYRKLVLHLRQVFNRAELDDAALDRVCDWLSSRAERRRAEHLREAVDAFDFARAVQQLDHVLDQVLGNIADPELSSVATVG